MRKLAIILVLAVATTACSQPSGPVTASADGSGKLVPTAGGSRKALPAFELANIAGGSFKSADLRGKVTVIDFWATWCENCIPEIPEYNALREKYKDQGFEVIGMTMDSGTIAEIKPKVAEFKMNYPIIVGDDNIGASFGGVIGYPTTFLVGKDGTIYKKYLGSPPGKKEHLAKDIETLLGENP
jgi:thiol-disulfide isomerase/thioredoxin